ncbi:hypothetical protein I552_4486 [Mycobacterium xenopi 3993]|nr:hypothetical protein I552_4486 [Mycobacterium xenopi 3993]
MPDRLSATTFPARCCTPGTGNEPNAHRRAELHSRTSPQCLWVDLAWAVT